MSADDFDETDLVELARLEGKSVDELRRELLRERLLRGKKQEGAEREREREREREDTPLARVRDDVAVRRSAGSRVVRETDESAAEALERWYEEEAVLPDGVHGIGGQTSGGIFGSGPIATSVHDPSALGRADARIAQVATVRILGLIGELERRLGAPGSPTALLSGGGRSALPPRRR